MKLFKSIVALFFINSIFADTNFSFDIDANKKFPAVRGEIQEFCILNDENLIHATASWKQYYKQSAYTSSFGIGGRHEFVDLIVGLNTFFDVSEHSGYFIPQSSFGFEAINEFFDIRANYYIPWNKHKINKKYEIDYFKSTDLHLIIKLFRPISIDLNPAYDFLNKRKAMKVEISFDMNEWMNIGLHVGSDFDKTKNFGIRFTFGSFSSQKDKFSSVSRNYHINYTKTKRSIPKPILVQKIEIVQPALPQDPNAIESQEDPFFLWRVFKRNE